MLRLIINDSNYKNLGIEYFFENAEELKKCFFTFVNPIKENSWLEKYSQNCKKIYNQDFVEKFYNETLDNLSNDFFSVYGTIMNGEFNNSPENYEYRIDNVAIVKEYKKPLAWYVGLSFAEVFPKNYRKIEEAYKKWFDEIEEDCKDSERVGIVDSPESMKEYDTFKSCCGRKDEIIVIDDVKYMFGCNFGH